MNNEALIHLDLEEQGDCVLVSSPQFTLLHLAIDSFSPSEIEKRVFPVLKEMVEFKVGGPVSLRLVESFYDERPDAHNVPVPPHIIASRLAL